MSQNSLKMSQNSIILRVSALKTITSGSGVKNAVDCTTFYVKRSSGARVMISFVSAFGVFLKCPASMYTHVVQAIGLLIKKR